MTLRIAKLEEPHQKRRVMMEKPVTAVSSQVDHPEPEVVGIPGLVRQMIGRFSCQDFEGMTNGHSHATNSVEKHNSQTASIHVKSPVSPGANPQRNLHQKVLKDQENEHNDKFLHAKPSDLHGSNSSSGMKLRQYNFNENVETTQSVVTISDSDSSRNLSKPTSARVTINASDKSAPPLYPKSDKVLNLLRTLPKNEDSSYNNCNSQRNNLESSEIKELNKAVLQHQVLSPDCPPSGVQTFTNNSDGPLVPEISQAELISNGQNHHILVAVTNGSDEPQVESKKCNNTDEICHLQQTKNELGQKLPEKDGHYFLGIMSDVESMLSKHCTQLEQFLSEPMTEEVSGKIRAAIGKANLLITKKFKQFQELCHKNLIQSANEPFRTTSEDLTGFWDLVQLQVDDIRRLFDEIYRLHENKWIDAEPEEPLPSPKVMEVKPKEQSVKATPKKAKSPATSELSKAREEARKRLMAAKLAGRQRKASETEEDIQIFIS